MTVTSYLRLPGNLITTFPYKQKKRTAVPDLYVKPNPPTVCTLENSVSENVEQDRRRIPFTLLDTNGRVRENILMHLIKYTVNNKVNQMKTCLYDDPFLKELSSRITALQRPFESLLHS